MTDPRPVKPVLEARAAMTRGWFALQDRLARLEGMGPTLDTLLDAERTHNSAIASHHDRLSDHSRRILNTNERIDAALRTTARHTSEQNQRIGAIENLVASIERRLTAVEGRQEGIDEDLHALSKLEKRCPVLHTRDAHGIVETIRAHNAGDPLAFTRATLNRLKSEAARADAEAIDATIADGTVRAATYTDPPTGTDHGATVIMVDGDSLPTKLRYDLETWIKAQTDREDVHGGE